MEEKERKKKIWKNWRIVLLSRIIIIIIILSGATIIPPSTHRSPYFIDGSWRVENEKGVKTETQ